MLEITDPARLLIRSPDIAVRTLEPVPASIFWPDRGRSTAPRV